MSVKAGQILHDANGFVVDRIQTGGVTNLNIPSEKIHELGNFQTVATIFDIPDLSFDLESLDVSTEIEALLLNIDPTTTVAGQAFDFINSKPMQVISPFKSALNQYDIIRGIAIPSLNLETLTYRFGTKANATQTFTLRGDSVYYIPGTPYYAEYTTAAPVVGPYVLANTALPFNDEGTTVYVLDACIYYADGTYKRLFHGQDFTDTATTFTLTDAATPVGAKIKVVYGSATAATYPQTVHQGVSVKPAAVRGKDLDMYLSTDGTPTALARWTGVTAFECTRRVNLDNDEEFGNRHYVAQDYDTADVNGTVTVRARDAVDLFEKIRQASNVAAGQVVGPNTTALLPLELRISHPDTGVRLKTLYIPDARFQVPNVQGRVQQKTDVTFNWSSDGGQLVVYQGARP